MRKRNPHLLPIRDNQERSGLRTSWCIIYQQVSKTIFLCAQKDSPVQLKADINIDGKRAFNNILRTTETTDIATGGVLTLKTEEKYVLRVLWAISLQSMSASSILLRISATKTKQLISFTTFWQKYPCIGGLRNHGHLSSSNFQDHDFEF